MILYLSTDKRGHVAVLSFDQSPVCWCRWLKEYLFATLARMQSRKLNVSILEYLNTLQITSVFDVPG
jgi:hypothetical protein